MIKASAALARTSSKSGVLFHGMAGGGKTSCALELIHHDALGLLFPAFRLVRRAEPGKDIEPALRNFALAVEREPPGFKMVHAIGDANEFTAWLPRLTRLLAQNAVLIALDNVESLLGDSFQWLDPALGRAGGRAADAWRAFPPPADQPRCSRRLAGLGRGDCRSRARA